MTKKLFIVVVLLGACVSAWAGSKLNPDQYQFVSIWGQAGYSTLLNDAHSSIRPGAGVEPALGVGYRLQYNDFLFQVGAEMQYAYWTNRLTEAQFKLDMIDTEDQPFIMKATLYDGKDQVQSLNAVVPVLFGFEKHKFYFLVGPELAFSCLANTSSQSLLRTSADYYGHFMDDFEEMPNHQLYSGKVTESGVKPLSMKMTLYAHAEVGARLGHVRKYKGAHLTRKKYRLYLAAYVDYGLLNIHNNSVYGGAATYEETEQGVQFYVLPAMLSSELRDARVNPLTVGVKFTAAFELPEGRNWMIYDARGAKNYHRVARKSHAVMY